jgi:hypothetical protein
MVVHHDGTHVGCVAVVDAARRVAQPLSVDRKAFSQVPQVLRLSAPAIYLCLTDDLACVFANELTCQCTPNPIKKTN